MLCSYQTELTPCVYISLIWWMTPMRHRHSEALTCAIWLMDKGVSAIPSGKLLADNKDDLVSITLTVLHIREQGCKKTLYMGQKLLFHLRSWTVVDLERKNSLNTHSWAKDGPKLLGQSPDLNPTENITSHIKHKLTWKCLSATQAIKIEWINSDSCLSVKSCLQVYLQNQRENLISHIQLCDRGKHYCLILCGFFKCGVFKYIRGQD